MADNIEVTAGSGTTIATDDVSGVHYQRVKLVNGTLGEVAGIPGDATNGLRVNTRGGGISISVVPVMATAGTYHAKDAVGAELTFANAARVAGGSGIINSVVIVDEGDDKAGLELWLFSATVGEAADHAAMDFPDDELLTCVGVIPISSSDYYSLADNGVACITGVGLQFKCAATSLFGQLKCTGTPTFVDGDLTVTLAIEYLD